MTRSRLGAVLGAVMLIALGAVTTRAGDAGKDQPWTLDANNWQEGKDLLPEPVVKRLQAGEYWFRVVPVDPARFKHNYSQAFWDATESNAGKYDLDDKACGLK